MNTKTSPADPSAELKSQVHDAVQYGQGVLRQAEDTADTLSGRMAGAPAYLEDKLSAAKDSFQRARHNMERNAKHVSAATDHYVRKNPWKSLGIATVGSLFVSIVVVSACIPALRKMREGGK